LHIVDSISDETVRQVLKKQRPDKSLDGTCVPLL
jgi:hypothetical protein